MEFLPKDVLAGLQEAGRREGKRPSRLRVQAAGKFWPVLRRWKGGFSVDAALVPHLRGLVNIYEGDRHIASALIVAAEIAGEELICSTKRETPVMQGPALDFVREDRAKPALAPQG